MPVHRQELATSALNGKIYVLGGYDELRNSTATVEVYNPISDTWTFAHALPLCGQSQHSCGGRRETLQFRCRSRGDVCLQSERQLIATTESVLLCVRRES